MKFSVGLAVYYSPDKKIVETIKHICDIGVDNVEIYCGKPFMSFWEDKNWRDKIYDIKETLDINNMNAAIHSPYYYSDISSYNDELRDFSIKQTKKGMKVAEILGADVVTVHPGRVITSKLSKDKAIENMIESLNKLSDLAEDKGKILCLENMGDSKSLYKDKKQINKVIKRVNSKYVKITLDIAHANTVGGEPYKFVDYLSEDIKHIHISDNRGYDNHYPIGIGNIDFKEVINSLEGISYDGLMTLEGYIPNDCSRDLLVKNSKNIIEELVEKY